MYVLKHTLKWTVLLVILAASFLALAGAVISQQGRSRLAQVKNELAAKGEKLTLSELLPPPIPDSLNVFEDPIWRAVEPTGDRPPRLILTPLALADTPLTQAEIAQGKKLFDSTVFADSSPINRLGAAKYAVVENYPKALNPQQALWLLASMKNFDPLLERISDLLERPSAKFRENSDLLHQEVYTYGGGLSFARDAFSARASARMALGNSDQAASDISALGNLIIKTATEPSFYMEMMRLGIAANLEQLIRVGVMQRAWSEEQLSSFEAILRQIDLIQGIANAFRAERGLHNQVLEELHAGERRIKPEDLPGPFHARPFGAELFFAYLKIFGSADQANLNRDIQSLVEMLEISDDNGFDEEAIKKLQSPHGPWSLSGNLLYMLGGNVLMAAALQTSLEQTRIACALERYRIQYGSYPRELACLVPEFLPIVLRDRYTHEPMKYTLLEEDHFELSARSGEETMRWANFGPR